MQMSKIVYCYRFKGYSLKLLLLDAVKLSTNLIFSCSKTPQDCGYRHVWF